jgi:hypothetical protein
MLRRTAILGMTRSNTRVVSAVRKDLSISLFGIIPKGFKSFAGRLRAPAVTRGQVHLQQEVQAVPGSAHSSQERGRSHAG